MCAWHAFNLCFHTLNGSSIYYSNTMLIILPFPCGGPPCERVCVWTLSVNATHAPMCPWREISPPKGKASFRTHLLTYVTTVTRIKSILPLHSYYCIEYHEQTPNTLYDRHRVTLNPQMAEDHFESVCLSKHVTLLLLVMFNVTLCVAMKWIA